MTVETAAQAAYIVAALLFILALAGLSKHETARAGNAFGMAGMAIALVATMALAATRHISGLGIVLALIALLHSFVGMAAVLVGWSSYLSVEAKLDGDEASALRLEDLLRIHSGEVTIGVFIGAVTFTGSIVAFLKLSARINSAPLMLPG